LCVCVRFCLYVIQNKTCVCVCVFFLFCLCCFVFVLFVYFMCVVPCVVC
jgi:hypothetical protein